MPELPEIETIKNGLSRFVLNKKIIGFKLLDEKLVSSGFSFLKKIKGDSFSKIDRLGKLLIFSFHISEYKLLAHMKMTGQLVFCREKELLAIGGHAERGKVNLSCSDFKHIRFYITFEDSSRLLFNDSRRFAYLKMVDEKSFSEIKESFGLEPLSKEFTFSQFSQLLSRRSAKNIKAFLLDQSLVAGIGNIYADEILFASAVSPLKKVASISNAKKKRIFDNIKKILKLAVEKKGTTFSDYLDSEGQRGSFSSLLKVYGREGEKCSKCSSRIKKIRVAGRGTHYCPKCQK
jgi:formamidopyrimidine-DNA glycosylase